MNLMTTILPFLHGCKSFIILRGGREIKINCMHIECLFFIGNAQIIRKCKTGGPVNHKQLTNALRRAIMFLWACFTTHSLRCLSFWKLVIRLTVQSNMRISVQLAMKSQLSRSLLFSPVLSWKMSWNIRLNTTALWHVAAQFVSWERLCWGVELVQSMCSWKQYTPKSVLSSWVQTI